VLEALSGRDDVAVRSEAEAAGEDRRVGVSEARPDLAVISERRVEPTCGGKASEPEEVRFTPWLTRPNTFSIGTSQSSKTSSPLSRAFW
jgi:hypothetical protein